MIKEIKYNGHSASPSDYQSPDGDMACMLNCIPERGALKPILPPEVVEYFDENVTVLAIHKVANKEHYILYAGAELYWQEKGTIKTGTLYDFEGDGDVASVTPIGNTLAVLDSAGTVHYFLWQNDGYKALGSQLPKLEARPYVNTYVFDRTGMDARYGVKYAIDASNVVLSGNNLINTEEAKKLYSGEITSIPLYGDSRQSIYNKVFACLNQFNNILRKDGFFTAPFYVRFAYRLYDGSHAMHTVPFLLVPTTWGAPLTGVRINNEGVVTFDPLFSASELTADIALPANISAWGDIITHIDVFVTPPLVNYTDSAGSITALSQLPYYIHAEETDKDTGETKKVWAYTGEGEPQLMSSEGYWRSVVDVFGKNSDNNEYTLVTQFNASEGKSSTFAPSADKSAAYYAVDISKGSVYVVYRSPSGGGRPIDPLSEEDVKALNLPLPSGTYQVYKITQLLTVWFTGADTIVRKYVKGTPSDYSTDVHHYISLQRADERDYADVLADYNNFYKVCELDIKLYPEGITGGLPLKKDVLTNITTHATLPDTGQSRSQSIVGHLFSYNNKLNAIVKEELLPSCASLRSQNPTSFAELTVSPQYESAYVKVVENSQTAYFKLADSFFPDSSLIHFAYPRATATELILCHTSGQKRIVLKRHPYLNLAYAFNMFEKLEFEDTNESVPTNPNAGILYGNKIKTSNVNNPFIFSEENTSELPVGEIYALSTAAKALSLGQFGQFPIYAFTDKGVWALEVTGTGTYSARQPITRDVVLKPESVTQIDDAVLFVTERGIMLLSGSQVQCISEILDGKAFDWEQYGFAYKKTGELGLPTFVVPWEQYKAKIQMLYDYTGQRIIVFNPQYAHAYVFSLESKQWGIMESNIKSTVDYYPKAYAMTKDGDLVDYSAADKDFAMGYYITRPLKLDAPDVHKTITGIIQRGQFKKGHVNTMLYGSRDLDKWYPIYGSNDHILRGMRGTPYKYFRIASTFRLDKDESITGCSVDYEPRLNNKLR